MKRTIVYIIVLLGSLLVPVERTDVGKLTPVELVYLYRDEDRVVIETDTKDLGRGMSVREAYENLENTTAGIVYLNTADYLLISENALDLREELANYLKSSVRVCVAGEGIDPAEAAVYLKVHTPRDDMEEEKLSQILCIRNGRMILTEKSKNGT